MALFDIYYNLREESKKLETMFKNSSVTYAYNLHDAAYMPDEQYLEYAKLECAYMLAVTTSFYVNNNLDFENEEYQKINNQVKKIKSMIKQEELKKATF